MANMVALATLTKLAQAGKLDAETVAAWVEERKERFGA
jgi:hypothetical protein